MSRQRLHRDVKRNERFGSLTALEGSSGKPRGRHWKINVECDCGVIFIANVYNLLYGRSKRCQECSKGVAIRGTRPETVKRDTEIVGQRVGFFDVIKYFGRERGSRIYLVRDVRCGHEARVPVSAGREFQGLHTQCGCPIRVQRKHSGYVLWSWTNPAGKQISVPEHRIVWERENGRALEDWEQVHHINNVGTDNRPGNLQLRQGSHGNGAVFRCHDCGSENIRAIPLSETVAA